MQRSRTPGAGITGTRIVSPGGRDISVLPETGSLAQRRSARALRLDHRADLELPAGRHAVAERLAHQAAEMRGVP